MPEVYLVESCRLILDRKIRSATGQEESVTFPEQDVLGRRAALADALQDTAMIFAAKPLDVTKPEQVLRAWVRLTHQLGSLLSLPDTQSCDALSGIPTPALPPLPVICRFSVATALIFGLPCVVSVSSA